MENIGFYHDCAGCAKNKFGLEDALGSVTAPAADVSEAPANMDFDDGYSDIDDMVSTNILEDDIHSAIDRPFLSRELLYADIAVDIGVECGALKAPAVIHHQQTGPSPASAEQLQQMRFWHDALSSRKGVLNRVRYPELLPASQSTLLTTSNPSNAQEQPSVSCFVLVLADQSSFRHLNAQQSIVLNIIDNHLTNHLRGKKTPQRLMVVHGEGGTGKSTVVSAITKLFAEKNASALLAKTAMSGVAGCIIGGQTLHSWAALPVVRPCSDKWLTHPGKEVNERRKANIGSTLWLIIDEMSMLTTPLLQHLSRVCGVVRSANDEVEPSVPFGGLSVILTGDFHQFPPIASTGRELYNSNPPNELASLGRNLYEQFDIVIILEQQMRICGMTF